MATCTTYNTITTVKHIISDCRKFENARSTNYVDRELAVWLGSEEQEIKEDIVRQSL